jgi:hypothetical protein
MRRNTQAESTRRNITTLTNITAFRASSNGFIIGVHFHLISNLAAAEGRSTIPRAAQPTHTKESDHPPAATTTCKPSRIRFAFRKRRLL